MVTLAGTGRGAPDVAARRRIYLMRHGAVAYFPDSGVADPDAVGLTEEGRRQAAVAGRALDGVTFDRVITSGMHRADETARIVLTESGTGRPEPEPEPDLREFHPGRPDDVPDDDLYEAFTMAFRGPEQPSRDASYLGGETVGAMLDRVNAVIDRLLADDWSTMLMVLHGGVNRAILSRALIGRGTYLGHIEQTTTCVNVLDLDVRPEGTVWQVRAVNVLPYDPVPAGPRLSTVEELVIEYRSLRDGQATRT
ncbi:histidine phosphatase family protein [Pseudonocardia endophytica]|uniref:Putative phosphoglycerate mutase n=1 Tax=Pseudonocardia endophytica TaxID=401976 RepID=A0A4R1HMV7_PSEEN|nr:histidine phosphatase family protein [Pseudonocardia endophytica]TCK22393.1 putative phosphoglycerate mutase [Pseudonocardia endophytica]